MVAATLIQRVGGVVLTYAFFALVCVIVLWMILVVYSWCADMRMSVRRRFGR